MIRTWWDDFKRISYVDARWLAVWILIYFGFITSDIFFPNMSLGSSILKYVGIFLCTVYANAKHHGDTKLILALFFTFLADTILVWTTQELAGVFVFCIAQTFHYLRLTKIDRKYLLVGATVALGVIIYAATTHQNTLYAVTVVYAGLLITNLVMSWRRYNTHRTDFHARCGWYGFVAFVACDFCVGLRHLMLDGVVSMHFLPLVAFLVWIFYYPSQVLLANSTTLKEKAIRPNLAKKTSIS